MEENVGQALRQDSAQEQNFDTQNRMTQPGSLMEEFSHVWDAVTDALPEDGLDAISDKVENFLQQFERAEYSLGHALDNPDAIDKAFLSNSENVVSIFDHHNFQYSLKETSKEQDSATETGKELDENQVTELGRLKNGIQDTAHEDRNRRRTQEAVRFVNMISAHEQYIADLEAHLDDLRDKASLLREQYDTLEKAEALLAEGDINEDSPNGAARRKELRTQLKAAGMDLDDFELPNGQIDQDALAQNIEDKKIENQEAQAANDAEIAEMERRLVEAQNNYEQANVVDQGAAPQTPGMVDDITPDVADNAALASDDNSDWGFSSWDDAWGESNWDSEEEPQNSADQQIAASSDNVVTLQTEEASRMFGSVAADEGERNIISSAFASAVSGETPATPTPDVTQEPTYTQDQRFTQSLGMG